MDFNVHILSALTAWFIAQLIKTITELIKTRKFNPYKLIASGGMPSSHSSSVTSLSTTIGFAEGFGTALFAFSLAMSFIVMYDAAGVRRAAGHQAAAINKIVDHIESRGVIIDKKLKELLGHSPFEVVAGAALGIGIGLLFTFVIGV